MKINILQIFTNIWYLMRRTRFCTIRKSWGFNKVISFIDSPVPVPMQWHSCNSSSRSHAMAFPMQLSVNPAPCSCSCGGLKLSAAAAITHVTLHNESCLKNKHYLSLLRSLVMKIKMLLVIVREDMNNTWDGDPTKMFSICRIFL